MLAAHRIRHGDFDAVRPDWFDTGEVFDTVIVGAGLAGLGAAYEFAATMPDSARCLILDDHPLFGGESKQNEFLVDGHRLTAPQGSNGFSIPPSASRDDLAYAAGDSYYYDRLGVPRQFAYSPPTGGAESIRFGNDNYGFMHWLQDRIDISHFHRGGGEGQHARNVWDNELRDLAVPARVRRSLLEWSRSRARPHPREGLEAWLDTLSCKQYLEDVLGLDPAVTAYLDPILAAGAGAVQGNIGRLQLFSTSYADYERRIIRQMNELFAASGFDAATDIAGIVLNRWGHAYVMAEPGFFFARNGKPPARAKGGGRSMRFGQTCSELGEMMKTLLLLAMSLGLAVAGPALADADSAPPQKPIFHAYKYTPPHLDENLADGMPATLLQTGGKEVLLSDSLLMFQAMEAAGQVAKLDLYDGLPHCFTFVLPESEESKIALAKQAAWFSEHLGLD